MQPYDLPTTPIPPTWTSNGLYSLTTRPDIAVHRSVYSITPRLFPLQTNAQQLLDPLSSRDNAACLPPKSNTISHPKRTTRNLEEKHNKRPKHSQPRQLNTTLPQKTKCDLPYPTQTTLPPSQLKSNPSPDTLNHPVRYPRLDTIPSLSAKPQPSLLSASRPLTIPNHPNQPFPVLSPLPDPFPLPVLTPLSHPTPFPVLSSFPNLPPPPASPPLPVLTPLPRTTAPSTKSQAPNPLDKLLATRPSPSPSISDPLRNVSRPVDHIPSRRKYASRTFADAPSRPARVARIAPRQLPHDADESGDYESSDDVSVPNRSRGFAMRTGNPLTVVRMGEEHFVVCAISGRLNSARVYNYGVTEDSYQTRQRVFRKGRHSSFNSSTWRNGLITDIVASDWDVGSSEPCRAVFVTKARLNFAHLCTDDSLPSVDWDETIFFPNALSVALNPLYPTECAAISADGVFVGTSAEISMKRKHRELLCIQPKDEDALFNRISYGQHPRSLLLASRTNLVSFDMRARAGNSAMHIVFDTRRHLNLPWYDRGICAFHLLNDRGYVGFLATRSCLNYVDLRMPSQPLLDWSLSLPKPIDQSCVSSVRTGDTCSEVISLWSRRQCFLEVYHALHQQRLPTEKFELSSGQGYNMHRKGHVRYEPPPVGNRPILWSDLPLSHLQQLKGHSKISGMALLPLNEGRRLSLLQWSATDGLIGQLLDIRAGDDTKEEFEAPPRDGYNAESAQRMNEFQRRLVHCGEYEGVDMIEKPLKKGLPGSEIMGFVKPQHSSDIAFARQFVVRDDDDDINKSGTGRFPRAYLRHISKVARMRQASGDARLTDERVVDGTNLKWKRVDSGKECGNRAHVNRAGDWVHSNAVSSMSTSAALGLTEKTMRVSDMMSGAQSSDGTQAFADSGQGNRSGMPFLGSPDGSENSSQSDSEEKEGESEMDGLMDEIGYGRTLDQIAEFVRKGMRHDCTPFGVDGLRETIESSGSIKWRDVKWGEGCLKDDTEDRDVISTTKGVPDWVHTRVYYTSKVPSPERVCEELRVEKDSELGQLVEELKDVILNEVDD